MLLPAATRQAGSPPPAKSPASRCRRLQPHYPIAVRSDHSSHATRTKVTKTRQNFTSGSRSIANQLRSAVFSQPIIQILHLLKKEQRLTYQTLNASHTNRQTMARCQTLQCLLIFPTPIIFPNSHDVRYASLKRPRRQLSLHALLFSVTKRNRVTRYFTVGVSCLTVSSKDIFSTFPPCSKSIDE